MDGSMAIGHVRVTKRDKVTGEITFDRTYKNQITNYAREQVALVWTGAQGVVFPSQIAVGVGAPPPDISGTTPNDTELWAELSGTRKLVDYATVWLTYYTQYSVTYQQNEAVDLSDPVNNPNGTVSITEAGLFDANGNLWSHVSLTDVVHDTTQTLSIQWQVLHQGN
jgi:hypothetical protein